MTFAIATSLQQLENYFTNMITKMQGFIKLTTFTYLRSCDVESHSYNNNRRMILLTKLQKMQGFL